MAKGKKGVYGQLKEKLADALTHAARLRRHGAAMGSNNPSTDADELVKAIQGMVTK